MLVILNSKIIKNAMVEHMHNVSTLARETGFTRTTIRRALSGYKVKMKTAVVLADTLDLRLMDMVKRMVV